MHARPVAASITALLGAAALLFPVSPAGAAPAGAPVVVAHRGASGYAPENTLAAVDRAAALGIEWENDVQRTKDRKSTRLNSSHVKIPYAAFCWKQKKTAGGQ